MKFFHTLFFIIAAAGCNYQLMHCSEIPSHERDSDLCESISFSRNELSLIVSDRFFIGQLHRIYAKDSVRGEMSYYSAQAFVWPHQKLLINQSICDLGFIYNVEGDHLDKVEVLSEVKEFHIERSDTSIVIVYPDTVPQLFQVIDNQKGEFVKILFFNTDDFVRQEVDSFRQYMIDCFIWDRRLAVMETHEGFVVSRMSDGRSTTFPK